MADKKKRAGRGGRSQGVNKSDFIRQHLNAPVREVVEKARAAGLKISPVLVYKVRSREAAAAARGGSAAPAPRSTGSNGKMSASDFVRSMPASLPAKDVVAAGEKQGIRLSQSLVYMVRNKAPKRGAAPAGRPAGRAPAATAVSAGDVSTFKKLALNLGMDRARQALDELERGLESLLRG